MNEACAQDHRHELLIAVSAAAEALNGRTKVVERDLENALFEALLAASTPVAAQTALKLDSWTGKLGPVDLAIDDAHGLACLELKWDTDLTACAWDAAKLATTLAERKAEAAYLIAGAPKQAWDAFAPGAELFMSRAWRAEGLLSAYAAGFAFWRNDVATYPHAVQGRWKMIARDERDLDLVVDGIDHQIRVVEIVIDEPDLQPVGYVPVLATWKRGARSAPAPTPPPAALDIEAGGISA